MDEFLLAGEVQEVSKKQILSAISKQDQLQEVGMGNEETHYILMTSIALRTKYNRELWTTMDWADPGQEFVIL